MELTKKLRFVIDDDSFLFRSLKEEDVTESYVQALKNQRAFLCNNPEDITLSWQRDYIERIRNSPQNAICGLFLGSRLIATAGMQNIKSGETATFGIFVIDTGLRGKGLGKTLVWASCHLLHQGCGIDRFGAGMEKINAPSLKSFLACGFRVVGEDETHYRVELTGRELQRPSFIKDAMLD